LGSFTVTAAGQKVNLDASGTAQAPFTVTNTRAQALKGRLLARPREPAKPEWLSIAGESVRDFAPNAAEQVVVKLAVPPTTQPGSYSFRLDAVSEVDPDEDFTEGPSVAFEVTPPPPPKEKRKFPWWIFAIIGAVVLLIIAGVVIWLVTKDGQTAVPAVTGLQQSEATSRLADAGFATTVRTEEVPEPALVGTVLTQDPAAGTQKSSGTVVTIAVGESATAEVPAVIDLQQSEATSRLADAGFATTVNTVRVFDPAQIGLVRTQDPAAGTRKPAGSVVTIAVGDSPTALVPGVIGLQQTAAANLLAAAGFGTAVRSVRVTESNFVGEVRTQDPDAGTQRPVGTVVTIGVGRLGIVIIGPVVTIRTGIEVRPRP
jgi:beta-lactam-binding protein with PASTA domain